MTISNIRFPDPLRAALRDGTLVVFAGAGVSMGKPACLPDFRTLAESIAEGTGERRRCNEPDDAFLGRLQHRGVRVDAWRMRFDDRLRKALLQSPAAWLSVCVICSERLRHERIQGASLPGGNRALGRTMVLPLRGQLPRPRSDDDRARRRGRPLHDLSLGAAIRSRNGETAALAVASAALERKQAHQECFLSPAVPRRELPRVEFSRRSARCPVVGAAPRPSGFAAIRASIHGTARWRSRGVLDVDDRSCPKRIGNPSEAEETPNSIGCGAAVALVDGHLWERTTAVAFGKCAHGWSVRQQLGPVTFHDSLGWGLDAYVARESPT